MAFLFSLCVRSADGLAVSASKIIPDLSANSWTISASRRLSKLAGPCRSVVAAPSAVHVDGENPSTGPRKVSRLGPRSMHGVLE